MHSVGLNATQINLLSLEQAERIVLDALCSDTDMTYTAGLVVGFLLPIRTHTQTHTQSQVVEA